jgi:kynurenine 3-monooxygenase
MNPDIRATETVTIAGAGLAGSLLAIFLARRGFKVELFERWGDPREDQVPAGRSINLALAERGIQALKAVGLHHRVGQLAIPMRGRMIHDQDGQQSLQGYGQTENEVIYSVHRGRLNIAMLDAAEQTQRVRIHFNQELRSVDFDSGEAIFFDHASDREYQRQVLPIFGCDGAGSPVRASMEDYLGFLATADMLDHSYKELSIPPLDDGGFRMEANALHIWPRGDFMMIALPNADGSFTNTLFFPNVGEQSFQTVNSSEAARPFFRQQFPDALPLILDFDQEFETNPVGILGTVRCDHWHVAGKGLLLGDAAHAVVPFHGQGMNCAFEDVLALDRIVKDSKTWPQAFARLEADRKDNANAIADMALENYIEMRSSVADPAYQLRRELERELERRHPDHFVPRYSMVMFRCLPYAEAKRRGAINQGILYELTEGRDSLEAVDYRAAKVLIEARLEPLPTGEGPTRLGT